MEEKGLPCPGLMAREGKEEDVRLWGLGTCKTPRWPGPIRIEGLIK